MTAEELATRLNAKRAGKGWEACCPAHEDSRPSLSISTGRNGGTLLHCHAGCTVEEVCAALGLSLADLAPPEPHQNGNGKSTIAATYDYTDEAGHLLFQCVRFQPKGFRQRRPDGNGGWIWKLDDVRKVLYRLPAVLAAKAVGEPIYVVEGEKDVGTLETWGLTATCNPMGAGKWRKEHSDTLRDAHVVVIPDTDEPGQKHADTILKQLPTARLLILPHGHKDVTEWATNGGSRDALDALLTQPPPAPPPPDTSFKPGESAKERTTDVGNARRMARLYGHRLRYCWPFQTWYTYGDGRWAPDKTGMVPKLAEDTIRDLFDDAHGIPDPDVRAALQKWAFKSESRDRLSAMQSLAGYQPGIPITPDDLDAKPDLLNLANGTLDLATGQLRAHDPADLLTRQLAFAFDPTAKAPRWCAFLDRIFEQQQDMIGFIQRAVGYSLTGLQAEQCFFFLYGGGANGKSVFLNTLLALFGQAGQAAAFSTFLRQRDGGRPRGDLARLAGARLVTSTEAGEGQRFDEELLKNITGGERITVRALYSSEIEFVPQFTLWLAANHRPMIRGADLAIWRRVCLVPFTVTIPEEERDGRLLLTSPENPLIGELPGILNWALAGYRAWRSEGLNRPAAVLVATEEYRDDSDALKDFIDRYCDVGTACRANASVLYAAYKDWCAEVGEESRTQKWFGGGLRERGYGVVKSRGTTTYLGICPLRGEDRVVSA